MATTVKFVNPKDLSGKKILYVHEEGHGGLFGSGFSWIIFFEDKTAARLSWGPVTTGPSWLTNKEIESFLASFQQHLQDFAKAVEALGL